MASMDTWGQACSTHGNTDVSGPAINGGWCDAGHKTHVDRIYPLLTSNIYGLGPGGDNGWDINNSLITRL